MQIKQLSSKKDNSLIPLSPAYRGRLFTLHPSSFFIPFLLITFSFLLLGGCSKNGTDGNDNTITVSGKVTLEGQGDHSGVTVSLYKPVTLDPELVAINQQYPNIGVNISQETEFDHRAQTASYSTTTNTSGNWSIEKVEKGTYNVVAEKDGFGWQTAYERDLTNDGASVSFNPLKEAIYLSGNINNDIVLTEGQFVYINQNTYLPQNVSITLSQDNHFLFGDNKQLLVAGNIIASASSSFEMTSTDLNTPGQGLVFDRGNTTFQFANITAHNLDKPFSLNPKAGLVLIVRDSYFKNCSIGISAKNQSLMVSNSFFTALSSNSLEVLCDFTITRNIFYKDAEVFINDRAGSIVNNLFTQNKIAVIPFQGDIQITQNLFTRNNIAIAVNSDSCTISFNEFKDNKLDMELNRNYVQAPIIDYSDPVVDHNNFFNSDTVVSILGRHSLYAGGFYGEVGVDKDISIQNCYWEATDNFLIDQRIYDAKDMPNYQYFIMYDPIEANAVPSAGIQ